jgi:predicted  nucleic acid-binding Zn-ribbon protein
MTKYDALMRKQEISEEIVTIDEEIARLEYEISEMKSLLKGYEDKVYSSEEDEDEDEDYGFSGDWWKC